MELLKMSIISALYNEFLLRLGVFKPLNSQKSQRTKYISQKKGYYASNEARC